MAASNRFEADVHSPAQTKQPGVDRRNVLITLSLLLRMSSALVDECRRILLTKAGVGYEKDETADFRNSSRPRMQALS
jgi:hypothetical protein